MICITDAWIPIYERFIFRWVSDYKHFGSPNGSRVERVHVALKIVLRINVGDISARCHIFRR
jgi:hypothetical protein